MDSGRDSEAAELLRVPSGYYVTSEAGDLMPLEPEAPLVIGRCLKSAGLVIQGVQVSRAHAEVVLRLRAYAVTSASGRWSTLSPSSP